VARNLFLLLPGVLAQVVVAGSHTAELAAGLFAEGRWQECIRECRRAQREEPVEGAPQVLAAIAQLRLQPGSLAAVRALESAAGTTTNNMTALAAFEAGRAHWRQGDATNSFIWTRRAFRAAVAPDLFARSGCLLAENLRQHPSLGENEPELVQTLETCRPLWTPEVVRDARGAPPAADSLTVRWIVALYRSSIRPAIGSRCSLTPSCSEYFLQAGKAHGLLAFPIVADRLVREPGVVQDAEHPVQTGEHIRYADPLTDHNHWLKSKGTK
jgi:putative component of membrane protein insertase Oxa1/YidC/SpoIIIJ protein YidD